MRLIDADKFRRYIHEQLSLDDFCVPDEILEMIDEQETVNLIIEQNQWITVEERLPEESGIYLVQLDWGFNRANGRTWFEFINFQHKCKKWKRLDHLVIAWQPLPQPYKKGDNS